MKLYVSSDSDAMLLDSLDGLNTLPEKRAAFLAASETSIPLPWSPVGRSAPYQERLAGVAEHLARSIGCFQFKASEAGRHHHPQDVAVEGSMAWESMSLLLEVDTTQE
jgi:hypothetical protein